MDRDATHLAVTVYSSLVDVLEDLQQVSRDLRAAGAGQILVPVDDVDFLTRRAEYLAAGAIDHIRRLEIIPHNREAVPE